jgi:hypothetical protein
MIRRGAALAGLGAVLGAGWWLWAAQGALIWLGQTMIFCG